MTIFGKLKAQLSGKLRTFLFSSMEAEIAAAMADLDRKLTAQKRATTLLRATVSRQSDILTQYENNHGLTEAALDQLIALVEKTIQDERKHTLFLNMEQRDLFLREVSEYIRSHHHDGQYLRQS